MRIDGLLQPVEIVKDSWGIPHIYAQNEHDLFLAQGYNVAADRLFQLELWRRQATGTLAEILGPKALERDRGARLLKFRGDMDQEFNHYHPQGAAIISAFVEGVNAYIDFIQKNPDRLPLEFKLLGIRPGLWTAEVVISRHNGLYGNVTEEIEIAKAAKAMGAAKTQKLLDLHPGNPALQVEEGVDLSLISEKILEPYTGSRARISFSPEDITDPTARAAAEAAKESGLFPSLFEPLNIERALGSNNWVVGGKLTVTGHPFLANDPHRILQVPSLRYWIHLIAPGWNVIGGGEPALPGVSIGHNEFGAWGLTIFGTDQEDLYVYETSPTDPNKYKYKNTWEEMKIIREIIPVKGQSPAEVELKFTRHGPILSENRKLHKAYALRAAWLETGCAPYLASLRVDQARNWNEFQNACEYSRTPAENMIWADRDGNIGWQATGIAPFRKNWTGLLPVPGDGRFEWIGFIPGRELPHVLNPESGYFATANQDNVPRGFPYPLGFLWADPFRYDRICEVLGSARKFSLSDMAALQQDYLSLPARALVPLLQGLGAPDEETRRALQILLSWDFEMGPDSVAAAIFAAWSQIVSKNVWRLYVPKEAQAAFPTGTSRRALELLASPDEGFGQDPLSARNSLLIKSLSEAVRSLSLLLGPDMNRWQYGQEKFHHVKISHSLGSALNEKYRRLLDVGPLPRGGNGHTVNNTSNSDNQASGATFRIIVDLGNWDNSLGTNSPGQSGDPSSQHYKDLFEGWAKGRYFPIIFSKDKIFSASEKIIILQPSRQRIE